MKLLKQHSILTCLFLTALFTLYYGCKKYPEGPLLSLHTKLHRVSGKWVVEYFSVNGYDSTEYVNTDPCAGYYIFKKDKEEYSFTYNSFGNKGTDTSSYYSASGDWSFSNFKNNLVIDKDHYTTSVRHLRLPIFGENHKVSWEIRKLTEQEMWLKGIYSDGRAYFIKLKQKSN